MFSFNLVSQPWIPVLSARGMSVVSLADVFKPGIVSLASGDELEDTATLKLLLAVAIAADGDGSTPREWVIEHVEDFDLFHPQRPFGQNADMAQFVDTPGALRPIVDLSYRFGGRGRSAANQFHSQSGIVLTPAEAARFLLVRHSFSATGTQPCPKAMYPPVKHPTTGDVKYAGKANPAVYASRTFVWIEAATLAETLAANVAAVRDLPRGTFNFTWTFESPPVYRLPSGVLDGLTHLARSIYLVPGDVVTHGILCEGVRWPSVEDKIGYTEDMVPALLPFVNYQLSAPEESARAGAERAGATLTRRASTTPKAPVSPPLSLERSTWRALLAGMARNPAPESVIGKAGAGTAVRAAGMATTSGQRIDGLLSTVLPAPCADGVAAAVHAAVDRQTMRHLLFQQKCRDLRGFSTKRAAEKSRRALLEVTVTLRLDKLMYPHVCAALSGQIDTTALDEALTAIVDAEDAALTAAVAAPHVALVARASRYRDAAWERYLRGEKVKPNDGADENDSDNNSEEDVA